MHSGNASEMLVFYFSTCCRDNPLEGCLSTTRGLENLSQMYQELSGGATPSLSRGLWFGRESN